MSGWFTDENGQLHKFAGGETSLKSALPVGAIFASALPLTDSSVHALDGTTISQTGLYEQFTTYLKSLIDAGYNISCTQEEFDNTISSYGQCGKFVINDDAKTIRLPKVTKFIEGLSDATKIGEVKNAGLPNITGEFASRGLVGFSGTVVKASGAFTHIQHGDSSYGGMALGDSANGDIQRFNASNSNSIYGNSTTVQPESVSYPYYIVLLSGFDSNAVGGGSGGTGQIILRRWTD